MESTQGRAGTGRGAEGERQAARDGERRAHACAARRGRRPSRRAAVRARARAARRGCRRSRRARARADQHRARRQLHVTDEEVEKTRLIARGELVDAFESVEAAARRLARNAGVGLPADHEAKAATALDRATKDDLRRLAAAHVDAKDAIVVIVGPRAKIQPQLEKLGITKIETSGPEGD